MGWTPHTSAQLTAAGANLNSGSNTPSVIIYPQSNGVTVSNKQGTPQTTATAKAAAATATPSSNPKTNVSAIQGVPISLDINTSDSSAKAIQSLQGTLGNVVTGLQGLNGLGDQIGSSIGNGFQGLMDLITQQTANNNAWSAKQADKQMNFQDAMNQRAMEFNSLEAAKNRNWQEYMSSYLFLSHSKVSLCRKISIVH